MEEQRIYGEIYESPVGALKKVKSTGKASEMTRRAVKELEEYFQGKRKEFTVPCVPEGTDFQKRVWEALTRIPYGVTRTYKEIAVEIGNSRSSRAVGMANHKNPVPIIIPCHRVIGSDGRLTGYAGGLGVKEFLLNLERGNCDEN